jgi:hypothetical protein
MAVDACSGFKNAVFDQGIAASQSITGSKGSSSRRQILVRRS